MPVFRLSKKLLFPSPDLADEDGLLAVGGDLSPQRLVLAYAQGIFPWYSDGSPILWWSPDPRLILIPGEIQVSRSLRRTMKRGIYRVTLDTAFREVIRACAKVHRKKQRGTWITKEMIEAYTRLHELGIAHSIESWQEGELAGGLYGVALGGAFFGESMFCKRDDASKVALVHLVRCLIEWNFTLLDCQVTTEHLLRFGAREMARREFLNQLEGALTLPGRYGVWTTPHIFPPKLTHSS